MANNYTTNTNRKLLRSFVKAFESNTVLTNTCSKQLVNDIDSSTGGSPGAGDPVRMKRPTQYTPQRTADGNMTGRDTNPVQVGTVSGNVSQNGYITVFVENTQVEEALEADQLDELLMPVAMDMAVELETELASYMAANAAHVTGDPDNAISAWSDIANAGALFKEHGAPMMEKYCAINAFDEVALADLQTQLGVNADVNQAWAGAVIKERFAGFNQVMTSNNLPQYQAGATNSGLTVMATPLSTYNSVKDTYQMTIVLAGATANQADALRAGQSLQFTNSGLINMRNLKTLNKSGSSVPITLTVLSDANADSSGNVSVTVSGAAIFETVGGVNSAYNTVDKAIAAGDPVVVLDSTANAFNRPALAYCKDFVGMGSVVLPKLHALDSEIINVNGYSIRVHRFSDGVGNKNRYRFDLLPTFACFNPFWGIKVHGNP